MGVVLFGTVSLVTDAPVGLVARDAAGFVGLATLAAALFGGQLSWTLPIAWAGVAAVVPPASVPVLTVLTWPAQAPGDVSAAVVAIGLGALGVACFAARGSRPLSIDGWLWARRVSE
jgi:hypothetical protein